MSRRKRLLAVAVALLAFTTCGISVASWLSTGSGPGAAQAAVPAELKVEPGSPKTTLYPEPEGGYISTDAGAVYVLVTNPNPYPVQVTTALFGEVRTAALEGQKCRDGFVTPVTTKEVLVDAPPIPANAEAVPLSIPGALRMAPDAEDGCQGASFTVEVTLTGYGV
jgi:hypothetical protein